MYLFSHHRGTVRIFVEQTGTGTDYGFCPQFISSILRIHLASSSLGVHFRQHYPVWPLSCTFVRVSVHQVLTLGTSFFPDMTLCSEMDHYHSFRQHTASTSIYSEDKCTISKVLCIRKVTVHLGYGMVRVQACIDARGHHFQHIL
jgi:hypothetical protein